MPVTSEGMNIEYSQPPGEDMREAIGYAVIATALIAIGLCIWAAIRRRKRGRTIAAPLAWIPIITLCGYFGFAATLILGVPDLMD